jgi:hypothetical protein
MSATVFVLERLSSVTPLAVRFRDEATRSYVTDRLNVTVYPAALPELRTPGIANPSGVYVFRNLPGLRDFEQGNGDDAFWAALTPGTQRDFVLEVRDPAGRYLPFKLAVKLPHRGVLGIDDTSSPPNAPYLPLFPSPSRFAPDGMIALRADIVEDAVGQPPAAWALVTAKAGEQRLMTGMADANGHVMLPLLYPKPVITLGSPGSVNTPLTQQEWAVDFTVHYRRRDPVPELPDLADVLAQPAATAWAETLPPTPWTRATLQFGRELTLTTTAGGTRTPALLITPAGSPP